MILNEVVTREYVKNEASNKLNILFLLIIFIFTTDLAIFLNIPFFRQIMGATLLTFIPGMLLIFILKINQLEIIEKVVLTVGLSVAFLMIFGWMLDQISYYFGYLTPLKMDYFLINFNIMLLMLIGAAYFRNKNIISFPPLHFLELKTVDKLLVLISLTFPVLSICGTYLMNTINKNIILLVLLLFIPLYIFLVGFSQTKISSNIYPVIILMISLSFLLMWALRSNHLIGADTHYEYYMFKLTSSNQHWQLFEKSNIYNSCLSITILPAIYYSILNINSEYLFKILYPFLFSISSLVVYIIAKKFVNNFYAFLSSLLFISSINFLMTTAQSRTNIGILFFSLAIMTIFHLKINNVTRRLLFIIFAISVIVSHYSTTFIFFLILLLLWLSREIILSSLANPNKIKSKNGILVRDNLTKKGITLISIILFFVLLFSWYSQLTEAPFRSGVSFVYQTFTNLSNFFLIESRGSAVQLAMGENFFSQEFPQRIKFFLNWIVIIFILIGLLAVLIGTLTTSTNRESRFKLLVVEKEIDFEYLLLSIIACGLLIALMLFPISSTNYSVDRAYFQMSVILSVFFPIGGLVLARLIKLPSTYVLLFVLIPYVLGQTGIINQVFGVSGSMILNSTGEQYYVYYIDDRDNCAAKWIRNEVPLKNNKIITDNVGYKILLSQGGIGYQFTNEKPLFEKNKEIDGDIYLRSYNVLEKKLVDLSYKLRDICEFKNIFSQKSLIYNNGGSEVWR